MAAEGKLLHINHIDLHMHLVLIFTETSDLPSLLPQVDTRTLGNTASSLGS